MRVQKQRQQRIPLPSQRSAACDNEDRSRCFVDLYRECIERAMPRGGRRREKSANTRAACYRRRNEATHVMIERPPRLSSTRWFSCGVTRGVCGYCGDRTKCAAMSARHSFDRPPLIRSLLNGHLKYRTWHARSPIDISYTTRQVRNNKMILCDKR